MNAHAQIHPPFTTAEFLKMASRGAFGDLRVELRRGMILKMAPQNYPHGHVQVDLAYRLKQAVMTSDLPWSATVGSSIECGGGFMPMPDIMLVDPSLIPDLQGMVPAAAVKLVVEVADSTLEDDLGEKRDEYAEAGLPEYWVADVKAGLIVRHADPEDGAYTRVDSAPMDQPVAMLTEPRLSIAAI